MSVEKARRILSYPHDVDIVDRFAELYEQGRARTFAIIALRHGKAMPPEAWDGPDATRPLLQRGVDQALSVAHGIAAFRPARLISSTAERCLRTIAPTARLTGLDVRENVDISQDAYRADAARIERLVAKRLKKGVTTVLCSHGPVLPQIISAVVARDRHAGQRDPPPGRVARDRRVRGAARSGRPPGERTRRRRGARADRLRPVCAVPRYVVCECSGAVYLPFTIPAESGSRAFVVSRAEPPGSTSSITIPEGNTVNIKRSGGIAAIALVGVLALASCAANEGGGTDDARASDLSGTLVGAGASSQGSAQEAWIAAFQTANPDVDHQLRPEPVRVRVARPSSPAARTSPAPTRRSTTTSSRGDFGSCVAGHQASSTCPAYISPIAVIFNVEGVDELNLDAATIADIFTGTITNWNDPAIAALNPDATLPDATITAVHRSDDSGTTKNFTDYLFQVAPDVWTYEAGRPVPVPDR